MNAIVFDFDGTIADSFDSVVEFLLKAAGRKSTDLTPEQKQALHGISIKELAIRLGVPRWRLPFVYWHGRVVLTKKMHNVSAFPGMEQLLADLQRDNYTLFIMSSNGKRNINRFLSQHGLGGYFTRIYGGVGLLSKGPALRKLLRQNGLKADTTVYVGDEVRDIVGARIANMPSVAVSWGFGSKEQLLAHSPTLLVRTPEELQRVLIDWGKTL